MKGQIIDYLIGRGFKVVAKEYLEKKNTVVDEYLKWKEENKE